MSSISSIVDFLHPTPSGIGIITTDQIWVVFNQEIDEETLSQGNFFITGPDNDTWLGPDLQLFHDAASVGQDDEILQSPGFHGIVQGTVSFERIDLSSLSEVSTQDTIGSGFLYRTKALITPTQRLQANTEYTVYLSGDEDDSDSFQTGLSARTVFDPVASGINTSTGSVTFSGGYNGFVAEDTFRIEVTTGGSVDDAKFTYTRDSDPLSVFGPFKTRRAGVLLADGVTVYFTEGTYIVGDQWSVVVKDRSVFTGNLSWTFKTGSGDIQVIPDDVATSVLGDPSAVSSVSSTNSFSVLSTYPENETSNLAIPQGPLDVIVTFDDNIDPVSVNSSSYSVYTESVTGDPEVTASGILSYLTHAISGNELTITIPSGMLLQNNLVTVTLDENITNTSGVALGAPYEFWFTTAYSPLYCSERRIRVMIGAYIKQVAKDTVNLAIHLASLDADPRTWNKENTTDAYYQYVRSQWTCCKAAETLLTNTPLALGGLRSKKLGDLEVQYDTSKAGIDVPLRKVEECLARWEGGLMAGGRQVQKAQMVVKGDMDPDRPAVGRSWTHYTDLHNSQTPAANVRVLPFGRRRATKIHSRPYRGWWLP